MVRTFDRSILAGLVLALGLAAAFAFVFEGTGLTAFLDLPPDLGF